MKQSAPGPRGSAATRTLTSEGGKTRLGRPLSREAGVVSSCPVAPWLHLEGRASL